jgi:hypothetical protein
MPYSDHCHANDAWERNVMRNLAAVAGIVLMVAPVPALAYTQSDADACTPDAFRLCQHVIPDADRVAACLASNKPNLSPACKIVFSRPATAVETPAPARPHARTPGRPLDIHPRNF